MAPKAKTPAPVDRPLSRAYLREFKGWSTAFPPGVSEPTTLRLMENVMVNRDGSCRIRPGLKYASYVTLPDPETGGGTPLPEENVVVGTHEPFFGNDGDKQYLFAVREVDGTVGFRVIIDGVVVTLGDAGFSIEPSVAELNFTSATTYVKYLQIDNKIFALSNAEESMRMFFVGSDKRAKRLYSIDRPEWEVADKLEVVHPTDGWINNGAPIATRVNRVKNPSFSASLDGWSEGNDKTNLARSDAFSRDDPGWSMRVTSRPARTNLIKQPLHNVTATGTTGWTESNSALALQTEANALKVRIPAGPRDTEGFAISSHCDIDNTQRYKVAFDLTAVNGVDQIGVMVRFFNGQGDKIGDDVYINRALGTALNRKVSDNINPPDGAKTARIAIRATRTGVNNVASFNFKNVYFGLNSEGNTSALNGGSPNGTGYYFWTGDTNDSTSVYHPPQDVVASYTLAANADDWVASAYIRPSSVGRASHMDIRPIANDGSVISTDTESPVTPSLGTWTRISNVIAAPAGTAQFELRVRIIGVARSEYHYIDHVMLERTGTLAAYFDGSFADTSLKRYEWLGDRNASWSQELEFASAETNPGAEGRTANTLIHSTRANNTFSFGFFYTFSNEIGESAASQLTVVRTQRGWTDWIWETPNGSGEPSGTATSDPLLCADQLVAYMPEPVFDAAIAAGATKWTLYMATWSDQEPRPVTALAIGSKKLTVDSVYGVDSWIRMTPSAEDVEGGEALLPAKSTIYNYSNPSSGGQGLVAADRMVMVLDPAAPGVIRWSSNQQGAYFDFSASKGGGYKTLTSGNLFVPACVKLWQNPQSVDTLTILCLGVDGISTGYYMAPGQVASQSEAVNFMGFEETTATPGTVSPYGCEVVNNALYHPLDEMLMKSTAANYNINHASMTENIRDVWTNLRDKELIVSSVLDNRIYFLVSNPDGAPVPDNCWGNEVWVLDVAQKQGTWSRWLTPGISLRKMEQNGRVVMSLVHPSGIYYFDENVSTDDYVDTLETVQTVNIPWLLETNTQGANRAHDAWAVLQQANVQLGFFQGQLRYGVRGLDVNGKRVDVSKVVRDNNAPGTEAFDLEDFLLIRKTMKEWFFYAESVTDDLGVVQPSFGQISVVQYRYLPSTVNTGYEFGSVETFEYGRADQPGRTTDSGVPMPYVDTQRP